LALPLQQRGLGGFLLELHTRILLRRALLLAQPVLADVVPEHGRSRARAIPSTTRNRALTH